jgi:hypothetical protein
MGRDSRAATPTTQIDPKIADWNPTSSGSLDGNFVSKSELSKNLESFQSVKTTKKMKARLATMLKVRNSLNKPSLNFLIGESFDARESVLIRMPL